MKVGDEVRVIKQRHYRESNVGILTAIDPTLSEEELKYLVKFKCKIGNYGTFSKSELELNMDKKDEDALLNELESEISTPDDNALLLLKKYVDQFREQEERLAYLKEKTKEQNKIYQELSQSLIPDLLKQYNLSEMKLGDNSKIIVKEDVSVTIKDEAAFFKYLKDKKDYAIIKDTMTIYNPSGELVKIIKNQIILEDDASEDPTDTEYELSRKIHPQTLKAYARKELERIDLVDEDVSLSFPPDSISIYVYNKTKIK